MFTAMTLKFYIAKELFRCHQHNISLNLGTMFLFSFYHKPFRKSSILLSVQLLSSLNKLKTKVLLGVWSRINFLEPFLEFIHGRWRSNSGKKFTLKTETSNLSQRANIMLILLWVQYWCYGDNNSFDMSQGPKVLFHKYLFNYFLFSHF